MKKLKFAVFLTLAGVGFYGQSAQALTTTEGDLFIGFRSSENPTNDYVIDIGQASLYTLNNGSTFNLSVGATGADLIAILGTDWYTSTQSFWGVIGGPLSGDANHTLYAGKPESTLGTFPVNPGSSYNPTTTNIQGSDQTKVDSMASFYASGLATSNSTVGTSELGSNTNSWASKDASPAFGKFTGFEGQINNDSAGAGTALDLFQVVPGNASPTYEGRFVIGSTGTITYTTAGTVPEPSALTALAGGAGLLGLMRRRRQVATA